MRATVTVSLLLSLTLAACGPKPPVKPSAEDIARAVDLMPADARLAGIYERSCMSCHSAPDSGAPLTGFKAGWAERLAKGDDALVANVRNGLNAMPARGLCEDCADEDYAALIAFMSGSNE